MENSYYNLSVYDSILPPLDLLMDTHVPRRIFPVNSDLQEPLFSSSHEIKKNNSRFEPQVHFNFTKIGVGGLGKEFKELIERALLPHTMPREFTEMYGIKHTKGILLYGPPGTGKTLIARSIASMFNKAKVKVVAGPELFNKYLGESEDKLRALFADAEKEWKEKGEDSDLHIIIFDEMDALFKKRRGGENSMSLVGDSLVNLMLSKMDGIEQIGNILVIGTTNRKDLIDEALLRNGRMGLHIKIGLPNENGRREILEIYTKKLKENNLLDSQIDLDWWASQTANFSGADLEGLIKEACFSAITRNYEIIEDKPVFKNLSKSELSVVTQNDLEAAFRKIFPLYGITVNKIESLRSYKARL